MVQWLMVPIWTLQLYGLLSENLRALLSSRVSQVSQLPSRLEKAELICFIQRNLF